MKASAEAKKIIKLHEGLRLDVYQDAVGVWTIGYGSTKGITKNTPPITVTEAEALLARDIEYAERAVNDQITVPLNQNQFDALVSFVFNVGAGNLASSNLRKVLNNKCYDQVPVEILRWIHGAKKPLPGLIKRRAEEALLFIKRG